MVKSTVDPLALRFGSYQKIMKWLSRLRKANWSPVKQKLFDGQAVHVKPLLKGETPFKTESLERTSDNDSLNLLGSFIDLGNLCISEEALDRELLGIAIAT